MLLIKIIQAMWRGWNAVHLNPYECTEVYWTIKLLETNAINRKKLHILVVAWYRENTWIKCHEFSRNLIFSGFSSWDLVSFSEI